MKLSNAQLVARLEYAATLSSWDNVHNEMKAAMTGLIRRGLAFRRQDDERFDLTDEGRDVLNGNKCLFKGEWRSGSGVTKLVEGAEYWVDQWNQKIPK